MAAAEKPDIFSKPLWRMKVIRAWPQQPFWPLFFIPTLFIFGAEFGYVLTTHMDASILLEFARQVYAIIGTAVKALLIFRFARKIIGIQEIIKTGLDNLKEFMPQRANEIEARRTKIATKIVAALIRYYTFVFGFVAVAPLISYVLVPAEYRSYPISLGPEEILVKQDAGFLGFAVPWILHVFVAANGGIVFDSYYAASCHYLSVKSLVLSITLEDVGRRTRELAQGSHLAESAIGKKSMYLRTEREGDTSFRQKQSAGPWGCSEEDERLIYSEISRCVKFHQQVCSLGADFEDIFSVGLFFTISLIVINMALAATTLVLMGTEDSAFLVTAVSLPWSCFQLVFFCAWADQVLFRSQDVADAAYSVYTAGLCSNRIKNSILMLIMRAQRPLVLTGGGFFKLNYNMFITALEHTYRLLTFALNFR